MIKAVDRVGVEQNILLGCYGPSNGSIFAFNFHLCSVPIPTNKFFFVPPCTPPCEIALRKENGAHVRIPLVQGIIYLERIRENKTIGVKK
jgi:hypothetical protein